ncbi:hypothetical protein VTP01DRAFT_2866 [Rhizomucor pusillus]|uniref:uncharacterized protein n=1 Tax=Rhizomucor pusillus TaxID=4840 RepID=UPI003744A7F9
MQQYKPFPLHPLLVGLFQSELNLGSPEEATIPANVRKGFDVMAAKIPPPDNVVRQDLRISGGPSNVSVNISVVHPKGSETKTLPAILFLHGGGWVFGSMHTHGSLVHELANQVPAVVIFVDYSPSPEARYPTALEECYAALCWTVENAAHIRIDPKRISVAGDSAGGNLSAALCILAKERGNSAIKSQILYYPVLGTNFDTESYIKFKDNNKVARHVMQYVWDAYAPLEERREGKVAPCNATAEQLSGLPPALIMTAEYDVLRDEAEQYAKQLIKAGVNAVPVRYIGVQHGFLTVPEFDKPQAQAAVAQTVEFLRKTWAAGTSNL